MMTSETSEDAKVDDIGDSSRSSPDQLRRDIEAEFNIQRAKMKELFLQKEEDLRKMQQEKEQLSSEVLSLRAELQQLQTLSQNQTSEIESLQLLVNETVEVSSSGTEEVRRLRAVNSELEQHVAHLKQQQQDISLAPATFVRSLARKLGGDHDEQTPRKNVEESELLQSIIQPLEMEITALKNKLRDTDTQLQDALKAQAISSQPSSNTTSGGDAKTDTDSGRSCDMCVNYEKQLVAEQRLAESARDQARRAQHSLRLATDELEGVRSIHDETVRTLHSSQASAAEQLGLLRSSVAEARAALEARARAAEEASGKALEHVTMLTVDRETLQKKLDRLERDNATLTGQFLKKAIEMQNEIIDLPDDVVELQEHSLRVREQLITCRLGRDELEQADQQLRAHIAEQAAALRTQERELSETKSDLHQAREECDRLQTEREQMASLADKLRHSNDMIDKLLEDKKRLQTEVMEIRGRVSSLQQELDNSEKVQQDFVRLSQSLQVQLQRIREADTEVRWQDEDDIHQCPACHIHLPNNKKKVHCRHCGRIFCASCVSHSVVSGPRRVPARVCAVCRTLLEPHAPPYFSTEPPT